MKNIDGMEAMLYHRHSENLEKRRCHLGGAAPLINWDTEENDSYFLAVNWGSGGGVMAMSGPDKLESWKVERPSASLTNVR